MTTKKKSLLGIGYLSLAMLSASLLMANPVSAEETGESQEELLVLVSTPLTSDNSEQKDNQIPEAEYSGQARSSDSGIVEVGEYGEDHEESVFYSSQGAYQDGISAGYEAGYQEGYKSNAEYPEGYFENNGVPEPQRNPYSKRENTEKRDFKNGYQDGYRYGYSNGWRDNHYIWSALMDAWDYITSWFQ